MPGVLTLEAMAQAGDWLVQSGRGVPPGRFCLQAVRAVKFMHFAQPGDIVTFRSNSSQSMPTGPNWPVRRWSAIARWPLPA